MILLQLHHEMLVLFEPSLLPTVPLEHGRYAEVLLISANALALTPITTAWMAQTPLSPLETLSIRHIDEEYDSTHLATFGRATQLQT